MAPLLFVTSLLSPPLSPIPHFCLIPSLPYSSYPFPRPSTSLPHPTYPPPAFHLLAPPSSKHAYRQTHETHRTTRNGTRAHRYDTSEPSRYHAKFPRYDTSEPSRCYAERRLVLPDAGARLGPLRFTCRKCGSEWGSGGWKSVGCGWGALGILSQYPSS